MNDVRERNISLNVRKNGNLLSQLRLNIIPKREAIVEILQGEGEGERYKILAREKTLVRLLFQLGGEGIYSVVINRKVGRRMRRDIRKQKGLRRFGKWSIDTGVFRRIKNEEMENNEMGSYFNNANKRLKDSYLYRDIFNDKDMIPFLEKNTGKPPAL